MEISHFFVLLFLCHHPLSSCAEGVREKRGGENKPDSPGGEYPFEEMATPTSYVGQIPIKLTSIRKYSEQPLYISEAPFCSSQNSPPLTPRCLPCSYSEEACQSKNFNVASIEGLSSEQAATLPNCECDPTFCVASILEKNQTIFNVPTSQSEKNVYRFDFPVWTSGFALRILPSSEGKFEIAVGLSPSYHQTKILASVSLDHADLLTVCPSHPYFGRASNTTTYFVFVSSSNLIGTYDITALDIPSLLESEEGPSLPFTPSSSESIFSKPYPITNSPVSFTMSKQSSSNIVVLFKLTSCTLISTKIEPIIRERNAPFRAKVGTITQSQVEEAENDGPSKFKHISYLQSLPLGISSDRVISVCPRTSAEDDPTYLMVDIQTGVFDGSLLIFVHDLAGSRLLTSTPISDLTPIQFQMRVSDSLTMKCPCLSCDECTDRTMKQINRFTENFYSTLLYSPKRIDCDLAGEIGEYIDGEYYFRCTDPTLDSSCGLVRNIPTTTYANPYLYPMIDAIRLSRPLSFSESEDPFERKIVDNSISFLFVNRIENAVFFSEERLDSCSVFLNNPSVLHTAKGVLPDLSEKNFSSIPNVSIPCNPEHFGGVVEEMKEKGKDLRSWFSQNETQLEFLSKHKKYLSRTAAYGAFSLMFSDEWQSCLQRMNDMVDFSTEDLHVPDSNLCGEFHVDDPCCNIPLQWDQCCVAEGRDAVFPQELVPGTPNEEQIESMCLNPECMKTFVEEYSNFYRLAFLDRICLSTGEVVSPISKVLQQCQTDWIGGNIYSHQCLVDKDCSMFGRTARCDVVTRQCKDARKQREDGFLLCITDNLDTLSKTSIFRELAVHGYFTEPNDSDIYGFLRKYLTPEMLREYSYDGWECTDDFGPVNSRRQFYQFRSNADVESQTCGLCLNHSFSCVMGLPCDYPTQCNDVSESCQLSMNLGPNRCTEPSEKDYVCNWNNNLSSLDCQTGEFKCMHCHNSSNCAELPAKSESECLSTPICLLLNGTVLWDVEKEECEQISLCSELCQGRECVGKEECLTIGGFCEDEDLILNTVQIAADRFPSLQNATKGVCIVPVPPDNVPPCPFYRSSSGLTFDFTSLRGCVLFSNCTTTKGNLEGCNHSPATPEECEDDFEGNWLPLPIQDQVDCENPLHLPEEEQPGFCSVVLGSVPFNRHISKEHLARKTALECSECGEIAYPSLWKPGRWIPGHSLFGVWREANMVPTYHYVNNSFSFVKLNDLFTTSMLTTEAFLNDAAYACLIEPFLDLFQITSCDCGDYNSTGLIEEGISYRECNSSFQDAFESKFDLSVGGMWFCRDSGFQIGVPPGKLFSVGIFVNGDLCKYADIIEALKEIFVGNRDRVPRTIFGNKNSLDREPVRNSNGASVGFVIGNGISFGLSSNLQPVDWKEEVTAILLSFLVGFTKELQEKIPRGYVLDFGLEIVNPNERYKSDELELRPLEAIGIDNTTTVGLLIDPFLDNPPPILPVEGLWLSPFFYDPGTRIFPIARRRDWKEVQTEKVLTEGETVMLAIFSAFYGLATVIVITLFVLLMKRLPILLNIILFLFVLLIFIFRCVFIAMYAAGYLHDGSAGYFVLVETPSFFILSVLTVLIMSYAFCVASVRKGGFDVVIKSHWSMWIASQILLYGTLGLVLGLLIGLDSSDTTYDSCFGRKASVEENDTVEYIRIAYHSFLLLFAIVAGLIVFSLGAELKDSLKSESSSLLFLSTIGGSSTIATNVLWVIYSSLSGNSPYFVIPLFFSECVPLLIICFLVFPRTTQKK